MFNSPRTFCARCAQVENPEKLRKTSLEFNRFGRGFTMVRVFEFGGCEAALSGTGCVHALMRRIPEAGTTVAVDVRPLTARECRPMHNRLGCSVSMCTDRDGFVRNVAIVGRGACARDLYESLRREGVDCFRVW